MCTTDPITYRLYEEIIMKKNSDVIDDAILNLHNMFSIFTFHLMKIKELELSVESSECMPFSK